MKEEEFKVIFRLSRNIPQVLDANTEFEVKYNEGDWYFKLPGVFLFKISEMFEFFYEIALFRTARAT